MTVQLSAHVFLLVIKNSFDEVNSTFPETTWSIITSMFWFDDLFHNCVRSTEDILNLIFVNVGVSICSLYARRAIQGYIILLVYFAVSNRLVISVFTCTCAIYVLFSWVLLLALAIF